MEAAEPRERACDKEHGAATDCFFLFFFSVRGRRKQEERASQPLASAFYERQTGGAVSIVFFISLFLAFLFRGQMGFFILGSLLFVVPKPHQGNGRSRVNRAGLDIISFLQSSSTLVFVSHFISFVCVVGGTGVCFCSRFVFCTVGGKQCGRRGQRGKQLVLIHKRLRAGQAGSGAIDFFFFFRFLVDRSFGLIPSLLGDTPYYRQLHRPACNGNKSL